MLGKTQTIKGNKLPESEMVLLKAWCMCKSPLAISELGQYDNYVALLIAFITWKQIIIVKINELDEKALSFIF